MSPEKKSQLLEQLDQSLSSNAEMLQDIERARNTADSAKTSRYDGQREIFAGDANLKRDQMAQMASFRRFVQGAIPMDRIGLGAEFTAELWDDDDLLIGAVCAPVGLRLSDTPVITPQSPIGSAIQGLKAGDVFTYQMDRKLKAGIINEVK
jgi:transcription elongation GreA/GreB family factor